MTRKCARCGAEHSRKINKRRKTFAAYCHACHAAYMRENRIPYSELTAEQRAKSNARCIANCYQRRGKLLPQPCAVCGGQAEKHHFDYSRPLDVVWLCPDHHDQLHYEAVA